MGIGDPVPLSLLFIPPFAVLTALRLTDTSGALILTYPTSPVPCCAFLPMGYFQSIPQEPEECALIDGVGRIGALARMVLPPATPGILSASIFAFTSAWNEFLYAPVFSASPTLKTAPVGEVQVLIRAERCVIS
jgi:multiple sugar transport system permease protein